MSAPNPSSPNESMWRVDYRNCISAGSSYQDSEKVCVLVSAKGNNQTQWTPGERLHHLFERTCEQLGRTGKKKQIAIEYPNESYSYAALEKLSNQFARFLQSRGVVAGARIALLVDRSIYSHAAVLAISKIGAAYVPLDASFPADRIDFIMNDSDVSLVLTLSQFMEQFSNDQIPILALDGHRDDIDREHSTPVPAVTNPPEDSLCYIIYTSGTTGRPKGVPINQSSLCNFLYVGRDTYLYQPSDRVYQGMTVAFDFSIEELWIPLVTGATLVPAPPGGNLLGEDLADFIRERSITAICCVPTLLETIESELPSLRFLMVSGEACPAHLSQRWNREGIRFLNTYGPTEATVSATWLPLGVGEEITIGGPLPTYSIVILHEDKNEVSKLGEVGEIAIAGIGLSEGYLGLPEKTDKVFIDDFIGLANNPGGKIYRTGDLGQINANNQIEFGGRVDTQVKIRGYRIELNEIEALLQDIPGIAQGVVNPFVTDNGNTELVAYFKQAENDEIVDVPSIQTQLRERLPAYMIPVFFEAISIFPRLPSGKLDRKSLPKPSSSRLLSNDKAYVAPTTTMESDLAEQFAIIMQVDKVSVDANFFDELGADSLLIAQFVSRLRDSLEIKGLSLKEIYRYPTVQQLAEVIEAQPSKAEPKPVSSPDVTPHVASTFEYVSCGVMQVAYTVGLVWLNFYVLLEVFSWINTSSGAVDVFTRSLVTGSLYFFGLSMLLIVIKWAAIGRFDDKQTIPLWGFKYVRFWIARSAIKTNPLNLTLGTPLYSWYLRMLGAKIGKRVTFFAKTPICVDLLSIGDDTVIREDATLTGYNVLSGHVRLGRITIGSRVYISEATVLDINSQMGDDAQLGTSSCLYENQQVPDYKSYQGSPAVESTTNFNKVPPLMFSQFNRNAYTAYLIVTSILFGFPVVFLVIYFSAGYGLSVLEASTTSSTLMTLSTFLFTAIGLYFGGMILNIARVMIVPRMIRPFLIIDKVHPLYGIQYHLARLMSGFSNSKSLNTLFGDSSMILHYQRFLGYDMSAATQTGSNFGVDHKHNSPFLCKFSSNTLVADGLKMMNIDMSNTSFKISQITMPPDTYLGNGIHYPVDSRVGANCLIATKAMVPIDGQIREGVGILGSPPFEIPRSVLRDKQFDHFKEPSVLKKRLSMKLRSNLWTLAMFMSKSITLLFLIFCMIWGVWQMFGLAELSNVAKSVVVAALFIFLLLFNIGYSIAFEKVAMKFKRMKPLYCSLYDQAFWNHERYWKLSALGVTGIFSGTPMRAFFLRLRGMAVGRMFFDDGASFPEVELVSVGDHCCFNYGSVVQCHSLEDGSFKSDHVSIGSNCNFGVGSFIHYGTHIDSGSTILADSFVMKGSVIAQGSIWSGNPSREEIAADFDVMDIAQEASPIQVDIESVPTPVSSPKSAINTRRSMRLAGQSVDQSSPEFDTF